MSDALSFHPRAIKTRDCPHARRRAELGAAKRAKAPRDTQSAGNSSLLCEFHSFPEPLRARGWGAPTDLGEGFEVLALSLLGFAKAVAFASPIRR